MFEENGYDEDSMRMHEIVLSNPIITRHCRSDRPVYVIGDIAGNYTSLVSLIAQFKTPCDIVALGDVIDRGPRSKEVIELLRMSANCITLLGNHEWICLNDRACWLGNGGRETLRSFGNSMPNDVQQWMTNLPKRAELTFGRGKKMKRFVITHAPIPNPNGLRWREEPLEIWNRYDPVRIEGVDLQIHGHNARIKDFKDALGCFAICVDGSHDDVLCAIELPSERLLIQPLIEKDSDYHRGMYA